MEKEKILLFNNLYSFVRANSSFNFPQLMNGYYAINIGTTIAYINGMPLNPGTPGTNNGESISFGGNRGEVFQGRIDVSFDTGVGEMLVIQKIYLPNQF